MGVCRYVAKDVGRVVGGGRKSLEVEVEVECGASRRDREEDWILVPKLHVQAVLWYYYYSCLQPPKDKLNGQRVSLGMRARHLHRAWHARACIRGIFDSQPPRLTGACSSTRLYAKLACD